MQIKQIGQLRGVEKTHDSGESKADYDPDRFYS